MVLHYVYNTHNGSKQLVGCVCRTDEGRLGYSAVHPKDRRKMSRKLARKIALGRAEKCNIAPQSEGGPWLKRRGTYPYFVVPHDIVPHLAELAGETGRNDVPEKSIE